MNKRIEDIFQFIESTGGSVKALVESDMPYAREIIEGRTSIPDGCPSRASALEFQLQGIAGRAQELQELLGELIAEAAKLEA